MNKIKSAWAWLVNFFERGDLVPIMVIVSAVHYAAVLQGKDKPVVAIAIGLLVDLGHFRTIRAAVRYNGVSRWQAVVRWLIAALMTALSLNYHERFYNDWLLSAPMPLLIAALAWLQHVDSRTGSKAKAGEQANEHKPVQLDHALSNSKQDITVVDLGYVCSKCGYEAKSSMALRGHMIKHSKKLAAQAEDKVLVLEPTNGVAEHTNGKAAHNGAKEG